MVLAAALGASAQAQTYTFSGNGSGNGALWSLGANWGGTAPASGDNNVLIVNKSTNDDAASAFTLNALEFNAASNIIQTGANGLVFASDGSGDNPSIQQLGSGTVGINAAITVNSPDTLTLSGTGSGQVTLGNVGTAVISGGGGVAVNSGLFLFNTANTYTGATSLSGGTLWLTSGALGTSNAFIWSGGVLASKTTTNYSFSNALTIANGSTVQLGQTGHAGITFTGGGTVGTNVTLIGGGSSTLILANGALTLSGGTLSTTGNLQLNSGTTTLTANETFAPDATSALTLAGILSDGGNGYGITINGQGSVTTSGGASYGGNTTVTSGTLFVYNSTNGGIGSAGTLFLNGGKVANGFTSGRSISNAVSVGAGANVTLGDATKTAALTFSGATAFGAGSKISTASAVTFSNANLTFGSNVTFAPGSNTVLTLKTLDVTNGVTVDFVLDSANPLAVTSALTGTGLLNFDFSGGAANTVYTVMTYGSTTLNASELNLLTSGYVLNTAFGTGGWQLNGTSLQVEFSSVAVPEPSAFGMLALGGGLLVFLGRRRLKLV